MAHVKPLEDHEIDDEAVLELFDGYRNAGGFVPNSVRTMAYRPDIAKAFVQLNRAVMYAGTVPTATKMLVALASSMAAGCQYCQSHTAALSSIYEAPDEKIAAIWGFETSSVFNDAERAAIAIGIKAGTTPNDANDDDFTALRRHFDEEQIVEIVATAAMFGFLNRWNDTMATPLEGEPARVAERVIGTTGWNKGRHK